MDLVDHFDLHAGCFECKSIARCCVKIESERIEFLRDFNDFGLIGITHRDENAAVLVHLVTCSNKALVERFGKVTAYA